jgi:hypothetical protein
MGKTLNIMTPVSTDIVFPGTETSIVARKTSNKEIERKMDLNEP